MAKTDGKDRRTSKIPFPQFDYPGSKISPFTGKPYTAAESARVAEKTKFKSARQANFKSAIQRRLDQQKSKAKGPRGGWDAMEREDKRAPSRPSGRSGWEAMGARPAPKTETKDEKLKRLRAQAAKGANSYAKRAGNRA